MTAQDYITQALTLLGVTPPGATPETPFLTDGLTRLQAMIGALNKEGINLYTIDALTVTNTGATSYTFGAGGTGSTTRYSDIVSMHVRIGTADYDIPRGAQSDYAAFALKSQVQPVPQFFYYDAAFPVAALWLAPAASSGNSLFVDVAHPLTSPSALSTIMSFPEAYDEFFIYNLAPRLAPGYGKTVPPEVREIAISSSAVMRRGHDRLGTLAMPAGISEQTGVTTEWWRTGGLV